MIYDSDEEAAEMMDVHPSEPLGRIPVQFNVPIPAPEQVAGEIARQILNDNYKTRADLQRMAKDKIEAQIEKVIAEKARPIIEDMLTRPLQPTDGFGNPIGNPISLQALLQHHIHQWGGVSVNHQGAPQKPDAYNRGVPRMDWLLGQLVSAELKNAVDAEVKKIAATLKQGAAATIAKQIGERVSSLFIK